MIPKDYQWTYRRDVWTMHRLGLTCAAGTVCWLAKKRRRENTPDKIHVMQTLIRVGWRFACAENRKVATNMGRRMTLGIS